MKITLEDDEGNVETYEAPAGSYDAWQCTVKLSDDAHIWRPLQATLPDVLYWVTKSLYGVKEEIKR